jgi:cytochrome P450
MQELELDLFDPVVRRDPYPSWARLRAMDAVVLSRSLSPSGVNGRWPAYVVHRFEDVRRVFADHERYSSAQFLGGRRGADGADRGEQLLAAFAADPDARAVIEDPEMRANLLSLVFAGTTMLGADRPEHDRLRGVVSKAFLPRQVSALEGSIRELTQDLVRPLAAGGTHELMETLADPLPSIVIAEMLGIPREDHARFKEWSNAVIGADDFAPSDRSAEDPLGGLRAFLLNPRRLRLVGEFRSYLAAQIERYRVERADNLISRMVEANENELLSTDELTASTFLLLIAGNETTTRLLANLTLALDRHPEQRARLVEDPARIPAAVEEALRYDPPVQTMFRVSTADSEIGGVTVPARRVVALAMAAANRDPRQFSEPDRFDIDRTDAVNVAFGYGIHFCLGAPLARRETRIAVEEMLRVAPHFTVVTPDDELRYRPMLGPALRGPERLVLST